MFNPTPTPKPTHTPTITPTSTPEPTATPNPWATPTSVPDNFVYLTEKTIDMVARVLGWWDYKSYPYLNDVRLTSEELGWIRLGMSNYITRLFMERCLDGLEYPTLTQELAKQMEFREWTTLEYLRDGSKYDFDYQVGINPDYVEDTNWYTIISLYRTGKDSGVIAHMGLQRDTCEPKVKRRTESGDVLDFRMEEGKLGEDGKLQCWDKHRNGYYGSGCLQHGWVQIDRWKWYDPLTNEEIETGRIKCRQAWTLGNPGVEWALTSCPDDTP